MTQTAAGTLQQALRAATRASHHALDHHPLLQPLVRPALRLEQYVDALAALHAPQALLETRLAALAAQAGLSPRVTLLERDLHTLDAVPLPLRVETRLPGDAERGSDADRSDAQGSGSEGSDADRSAAEGRGRDDVAQLGCLYVLEGSNLGAAFIAQRLARGDASAGWPRRFFEEGGAAGASRWSRFWTLVETRAGIDDAARIGEAAIACFDLYRRHLDDCVQRTRR